MKKPLVPCTWGSVCRNSGRVGVAELRPRGGEGVVDLEPGGVDDRLGLVAVDGADGVEDGAARPHARGRGLQQLELELGQRLGAPAEIGPGCEDAEPRARSVDERPVEARQLLRQSAAVGADDLDVRRSEPARRSPRARARGRRSPRRRRPRRRASSPCLPARRRGRAPARPQRRRPRARRAGSRRSAATPGPRRMRSRRRARRARRRERPDRARRRSRLARAGRRSPGATFWARISASAPSAPRSRHHVSATQSGYECATAASSHVESGRASTPAAPLVGEAAEHGVRERHRPLEPRPADELDRLVDGRVAGHAVEEDELVGAEAQRRAHGGIETADRPAAGDLDRVVERAGALHRAVRELPARARDRGRRGRRWPSARPGRRTPPPRRRGG